MSGLIYLQRKCALSCLAGTRLLTCAFLPAGGASAGGASAGGASAGGASKAETRTSVSVSPNAYFLSAKQITLFLCLWLCGLTAWAQKPAAPPQLKPIAPPRYELHAGDVLEIQYRYTPEFNQTVRVQPDGYISLLIGGDVKVLALSLDEVREKVLEQARQRLKDPDLTVVLKEFQQPFFVVAGEVGAPGRFELRDQVTALQAILLAGGFKESANTAQVLVLRRLNDELAEVKILNLKTVKSTSDLENDLSLMAGDMILVPRNRLSKIERYVRLASLATFVNPLLRR